MIGVDESGLGAFLGSMFVVGIQVNNVCEIPDDVTDSKDLDSEKRKELADKIWKNDSIRVKTVEVKPSSFEDFNGLEEITYHHHAIVINRIGNGRQELVMVDACNPDEKVHTSRVERKVDNPNLEIVSEHKADKNYKVVSAASIIAKESRERHISEIESQVSNSIGSGYPGDDRSEEFLKRLYDKRGSLPSFVRKNWKTCKRITDS